MCAIFVTCQIHPILKGAGVHGPVRLPNEPDVFRVESVAPEPAEDPALKFPLVISRFSFPLNYPNIRMIIYFRFPPSVVTLPTSPPAPVPRPLWARAHPAADPARGGGQGHGARRQPGPLRARRPGGGAACAWATAEPDSTPTWTIRDMPLEIRGEQG